MPKTLFRSLVIFCNVMFHIWTKMSLWCSECVIAFIFSVFGVSIFRLVYAFSTMTVRAIYISRNVCDAEQHDSSVSDAYSIVGAAWTYAEESKKMGCMVTLKEIQIHHVPTKILHQYWLLLACHYAYNYVSLTGSL